MAVFDVAVTKKLHFKYFFFKVNDDAFIIWWDLELNYL